jgi:hypothetical protein
MSARWRVGLFIGIVGLAFGGVFLAAGGVDLSAKPSAATVVSSDLKHGNSGKYLYDISNLTNRNMKRVQFDPSLPVDDMLVVNILKAVAHDGYGLVIDEATQPVVETISEVNFVTFTVGRTKVLFELFRNSSGGIGMADFSKQQLP